MDGKDAYRGHVRRREPAYRSKDACREINDDGQRPSCADRHVPIVWPQLQQCYSIHGRGSGSGRQALECPRTEDGLPHGSPHIANGRPTRGSLICGFGVQVPGR
jgi:hypothetical protein